ncbi:hypothetical protein [Geoglobus acetivorans]|uniref:Uncharacterized protein n=1 Tax=Geoglobus acetivorans TaxID=565033 RepID=A0A0A7GAT7_GEOAI|nr:hypothetical protein GACE_0098 [Geoglobus acetivorans]
MKLFETFDLKTIFIMLVFAGLVVGGLQLAFMWLWVLSSGAIPAYEGGVHVIAGLVAALLAINGLLRVYTSYRTKS